MSEPVCVYLGGCVVGMGCGMEGRCLAPEVERKHGVGPHAEPKREEVYAGVYGEQEVQRLRRENEALRGRSARVAEVARTIRARGDALIEGAGDDEDDAWMGVLGEHYQLLAGEIEEALAGSDVISDVHGTEPCKKADLSPEKPCNSGDLSTGELDAVREALREAVGLLSRESLIAIGYDKRQEWQRMAGLTPPTNRTARPARYCPVCGAGPDKVGEAGSECWTEGCDGVIASGLKPKSSPGLDDERRWQAMANLICEAEKFYLRHGDKREWDALMDETTRILDLDDATLLDNLSERSSEPPARFNGRPE